MLSCELCKIFKNTFFHKTAPVAASVGSPEILHFIRVHSLFCLIQVYINLEFLPIYSFGKVDFRRSVFLTWYKSGTRSPGSGTSGSWDSGPPQSLRVGPGTLLKFKSGAPGPPSKFKSGALIIIFLHCLTYFVLDKYII